MSESPAAEPAYNKKLPWVIHFVVSLIIVAITIGILSALFSSKPEGKRWGNGQPAPSVAVDIVDLQIRDYDVWIDSYGTAEPLTSTELVADISGKVMQVSPNIRAGSRFSAGDVLVQLDDRDFRVEVNIAESVAAEAEVRYLQEIAEAEFASQQWNKQPSGEAAKLLALRKPQVAAAEANLKAAKARLARAELDLERTKIRAPFDGKVLTQNIDIGQVVSPSQTIASIYSTDIVEVRLPIKVADLEHLYLPDESANTVSRPKVQLIGELGSTTYEWQGEIVRSEGAFDPATRMLYVVAQVEEPFIASSQRPAMRVGQFLRAKVEGQSLENVFIIPRRAVSQDNKVSVADEGVLRKRSVRPLWTDARNVIVAADSVTPQSGQSIVSTNRTTASLKSTDKLILTPTANLPDGTKVKSLEDTQPTEHDVNSMVGAGSGNTDSANANSNAAAR